jgi:FkbM family methyltransferase
MRFLKNSLRRLFQRLGYEVVTRSRTPLLEDLTRMRNELNLSPSPLAQTVQFFANSTAAWHLCWLLQHYNISLVLDVGANQGQFAQLLRRHAFRGQIESFEPLSRCVAALRILAANDRYWTVHPFALGARTCESRLKTFVDSSFSSFHQTTSFAHARFGNMLTDTGDEAVKVETLSSLWPDLTGPFANPKILLKIDTQGHDLAVLQGARDALSEIHSVMCEVSLVPLYEGIPTYLDIFAFLQTHGFECSGVYPVSYREDRPTIIELNAFFINARLSASST